MATVTTTEPTTGPTSFHRTATHPARCPVGGTAEPRVGDDQPLPEVDDVQGWHGRNLHREPGVGMPQSGRCGVIVMHMRPLPFVLAATACAIFPVAVRAAEPDLEAASARFKKYFDEGDYRSAIDAAQEAGRIALDTYGPDAPETAACAHNLAEALVQRGFLEDAEALLMHALSVNEKKLGVAAAATASDLNSLGHLSWRRNKPQAAEGYYKRALQAREKTLGADHVDTATTLDNLAVLYDSQQRFRESEPLHTRAIAIFLATPGHEVAAATAINNLAEMHSKRGELAAAEKLYRRSLEILEKKLGVDHPTTALSLGNVGAACAEQGLFLEAETMLQRALAVREKHYGQDHEYTINALYHLGSLYADMGRYEAAEPLLTRAVAAGGRVFGPDDRRTGMMRNLLRDIRRHTPAPARARTGN